MSRSLSGTMAPRVVACCFVRVRHVQHGWRARSDVIREQIGLDSVRTRRQWHMLQQRIVESRHPPIRRHPMSFTWREDDVVRRITAHPIIADFHTLRIKDIKQEKTSERSDGDCVAFVIGDAENELHRAPRGREALRQFHRGGHMLAMASPRRGRSDGSRSSRSHIQGFRGRGVRAARGKGADENRDDRGSAYQETLSSPGTTGRDKRETTIRLANTRPTASLRARLKPVYR